MKSLHTKTLLTGFAFALFALMPTKSDAGVITGIGGSGPGMTLVSSSFTNVVDGAAANTATLDFSIDSLAELGATTDVVFSLSNLLSPGGGIPEFLTYSVTVNITNNLIRTVPGFDVVDGAGTPGFDGLFPFSSTPTSDFTIENPSFPATNLPAGWRFGGLNGGGHAVAPGGTAVTTFDYIFVFPPFVPGPVATGSATLHFTANPEPTTILLGALVLVPGIVIARRRRRKGEKADAAV